MSSYAPPTGPPPPKIPAGWEAIFDDRYQEYFYVNIYTKQSQWHKPTEPIYGPPDGSHAPPSGGPPGYDHSSSKSGGAEKPLASNNPYGQPHQSNISEDERLARQLQAEEDARGQGGRPTSRGAADSYYGGGAPSPYQASPGPQGGGGYGFGGPPGQGGSAYGGQGYDQQQLPPRPEQKGFLGKLMGKGKSSSQQGYPPPQQGYGGYPGQQPGYGPPPGQYGGYPQQQPMYMQQQQPQKKHGLGAGGAAALGVGGGLLGGVMLGEAMDGGDGGDDGGDFGGDDGGFGGDDGGGDFGGD